jgi:hypothetical protein
MFHIGDGGGYSAGGRGGFGGGNDSGGGFRQGPRGPGVNRGFGSQPGEGGMGRQVLGGGDADKSRLGAPR